MHKTDQFWYRIEPNMFGWYGVLTNTHLALQEALGEKIWGWVKSPLPIDCSMEILDLFEEKI